MLRWVFRRGRGAVMWYGRLNREQRCDDMWVSPHIYGSILDHFCSILIFLGNWLLTYSLIELCYSFTHVPSWSLLMSYVRCLVYWWFNRMEILDLYVILIIRWSVSLLALCWLLLSRIFEACLLLITTWSIWLAASLAGDIQFWRWIFLWRT